MVFHLEGSRMAQQAGQADELTLSACSTRLSAGRGQPVMQPIIEPPRVQGRPFAGPDWLLRPLPSEPPQWNFGENPLSSLANLDALEMGGSGAVTQRPA